MHLRLWKKYKMLGRMLILSTLQCGPLWKSRLPKMSRSEATQQAGEPAQISGLGEAQAGAVLPEDPRAPLHETDYQATPSAEPSQGNSVWTKRACVKRGVHYRKCFVTMRNPKPNRDIFLKGTAQTPEKDPAKTKYHEASVLQLDQLPALSQRETIMPLRTYRFLLYPKGQKFCGGDLMNFDWPRLYQEHVWSQRIWWVIPRSKFIETLSALYEPRSASLIEDYGNLCFWERLAWKINIRKTDALLWSNMQKNLLWCVTPEKLFEADRFGFMRKCSIFHFLGNIHWTTKPLSKQTNRGNRVGFSDVFRKLFCTSSPILPIG